MMYKLARASVWRQQFPRFVGTRECIHLSPSCLVRDTLKTKFWHETEPLILTCVDLQKVEGLVLWKGPYAHIHEGAISLDAIKWMRELHRSSWSGEFVLPDVFTKLFM
jgi:hypothetical protein